MTRLLAGGVDRLTGGIPRFQRGLTDLLAHLALTAAAQETPPAPAALVAFTAP